MTHPAGDYALTVGDRIAISLTVASATGARPLVTVTGTVEHVTPAAVILADPDGTHRRRVVPFAAIAIIEQQAPAPVTAADLIAQHPAL